MVTPRLFSQKEQPSMIDLHCHTTASDGLLTPSALIRKASREGISVIAIADHDTVDGLDEAVQAAQREGVAVIPAVELSVTFPGGDFHLLGYGLHYQNQDLKGRLARLKSVREERALRMVEQLSRAGIPLAPEDVRKESKGASPGKPHVARVLIKKGYAADVDSAFETYLNPGKPGYVPKEKLTFESAFELIRNAGGLPVLAHPKSLNLEGPEAYERIIQQGVSYGMAGIEVYAPLHDPQYVILFRELAERFHLIATGGSDFHGDKGTDLGYYGCGRPIPESCSLPLLPYIATSAPGQRIPTFTKGD